MRATFPKILTVLSLMLAGAAHATPINYIETWTPTTARQADNTGDVFPDYAEWQYYERDDQGANARVDLAGELTLAGTGTVTAALVGPDDVGSAGAAFDVSTHPLVVSTTIGSRFGGAGNFNAGVTIGDVAFILHPGFAEGAHRVHNRDQTVTHQGNTNLGFAPGTTTFTPATFSVIENGANYDFVYNIGSYNNAISLPIATVGPITDVGLTMGGAGDGNFGSITITQVPEPSTLALALLGLLGWIGRHRSGR